MKAPSESRNWFSWLAIAIQTSIRRMLLWILVAGPIPHHIAVIMDGNRRFAQRRNLQKKSGHEFGAETLIQTLKDCYELGVKYVTVYVFSIENFKRSAEEVDVLTDLLQRRLESLLEKESLVNRFGVRVQFPGNLGLLPDRVRRTVEKVTMMTKLNDRAVLNVCIAYTSKDEIVHAVQGACQGFMSRVSGLEFVKNGESFGECVTVEDIERHLYTAGCPDPDLLIRTSGETRLSNFLLWQSGFCYLQACGAMWPEFSFRHFFMAVLCYQRAYSVLKQKNKSFKGLYCHSE